MADLVATRIEYTLGTVAATAAVIGLGRFRGMRILNNSGGARTLTVHDYDATEDKTFTAADFDASGQISIGTDESKELPSEMFAADLIKITGNTAGTLILLLKT